MSAPAVIREERADDIAAIHDLVQAAFGTRAEADLVDALRRDGHALVSLVAEAEGQLVGHVMFSVLPITGGTGMIRAAALAPLSVAPAWQGRGIGAALVRAGLQACPDLGVQAAVVLGDPAYYGRFGFSSEAAREIVSPYSGVDGFMALALQPGVVLAGEARYARAFADLD